MQPNSQPNSTNGHTPAPGMNVDDIVFTLFRHKWLIAAFFCLGVIATFAVRVLRPPVFMSHAKLRVHYVEERAPAPGTDDAHVIPLLPAVQGILNVEKEIIRNLDVAASVASTIGPERLLAKNGGGRDLMSAAGLVCGSLDVDVPQATPILTVSFRHRDKTLVQPVVGALIDAYMRKHNEMHGFSPDLDEFYKKQREELRERFAATQQELTTILATNRIASLADTKRFFQEQRAKWQDALRTAEVELATHKAILGESAQAAFASGSTNAVTVPTDKVEEYTTLMDELNHYKKREREFRQLGYTDAHFAMLMVHGEIDKINQQKAKLLSTYPALVDLPLAVGHSPSNSPASSLNGDLAEIKMLAAKVGELRNVITNIEQDLSSVLKLEPLISDLTLQRDLQATNLEHFSKSLDMERVSQALGSGKMVNISILEKPTPPDLDRKKMMKLVMGAFGGCLGLGLGLAFLIDFVLDRSIKRRVDVERHLHLSVMQSIPHTNWSSRLRLPWTAGGSKGEVGTASANGENGHANTSMALWDPTHHLDPYTTGLSERLMTYFEVNDKNLKKPKLVGFTACARGSGVTTLASGLAACLSKTGNGNVLFVDMNSENGEARSFHEGKAGCGLTDALEPGAHAQAQVEENLFVATINQNVSNKLVKAEPNRFASLMPKIKTSDYDYIIFDLPPVSQTNSTARLAGYMDITLLVLESEKTGKQAAAQATALMRDARANVATVLNKCPQHVPARLSQDL